MTGVKLTGYPRIKTRCPTTTQAQYQVRDSAYIKNLPLLCASRSGQAMEGWEQTENKLEELIFTLEERDDVEHCEEKQGGMETQDGKRSFYFRQGCR